MKGKAQPQHAGLLAPVRERAARARVLRIDATHHRIPVRMCSRRSDAEIVAVALPRRRHDYDAVDARFVHFPQKIVGRERYRTLRLRALRPRALRCVRAPYMYL